MARSISVLGTLLAVAVALGPAATPAAAQTRTCPQPVNPPYTGPCGPTFVLPGWGDAGGWTRPEQYETIQLADIDGDGADELLARKPAGLAIHVFDKTLGQWRPQVDANNVAVILTAFANPPPLTTANPNPPATDWTLPQYYDTIQAADIDGQKGEEVIGRSAGGLIVFKFTPGQGWSQLPSSDVFAGSGWDTNPSQYATIQTGDLNGDGAAEVLGRESDGIVAVRWTGSPGNPWVILPKLDFLGDDDQGQKPAYYASLQTANIDGDSRHEVVGRDESGVLGYKLGSGGWTQVNRFSQPFADLRDTPDCPFPNGSCFGDGAAYYATIQFADLNGDGRQELVGRASDGLRVLRYQGDTPDPWGRLPTLTDLSDANGYSQEQYWETIQFADINGDGRDEALARDKNGLNAWSYDPGSKGWTKLGPSTALALADDPWAGDRSYYSTIQTGDVDGDKRADVVARGPYGIRTWFYNRRGTGGWERYLPDGYPAFPTRNCPAGVAPPCGQEAAFNELNTQAKAQGVIVREATTVRDVYTSLDAPSSETLTTLSSGLVGNNVGNCSNPTSDKPPQYASCTPPAGTSGSFTADEWRMVLNTILAEVYWAGFVVGHFSDMDQIKGTLFLEEGAQLPGIGSDLQLAPAAGTPAEFDAKEIISSMLSIAGVVAEESPLGPVLDIAAELTAMLPSASPTMSGPPFQGKYDDFVKRFANSIADVDTALEAHSQTVRQDPALLALVGQLRSLGTWSSASGTLAKTGMESVGRQGWMLSVWKTLLPTLWARYFISNCTTTSNISCQPPPRGAWMLGTSTNFSAIGPTPTRGLTPSPCYRAVVRGKGYVLFCHFLAPDSNLANIVWGQLSQSCAFDGLHAGTAWRFPPECTLGVDPSATLADSSNPMRSSASQGWAFPTYTGSPGVFAGTVSAGSAGPVGDDAAVVPNASASRSSGDGAVVRLRGTVAVPRRLLLTRARVVFDRLLFERRGAGELVRHHSGRRLPPLILSRRGGPSGRVFASPRRGGPEVAVRLRRSGQGLLSFRLKARDVRLPSPPTACSGTRPEVDLATGPIPLHTRLRIDDGRRRPLVISLRPQWVCRRDRLGNVRRLVLSRPTFHRPAGRSPAVAVRGPRRVAAGKSATYRITVRNRRRTPAYDVRIHAVLPPGFRPRRVRGARVGGRQVVWRLHALRPGRSRSVRLRMRIPRSLAPRRCLGIVADAIDTRAGRRRICIRVRAPARRAPRRARP